LDKNEAKMSELKYVLSGKITHILPD